MIVLHVHSFAKILLCVLTGSDSLTFGFTTLAGANANHLHVMAHLSHKLRCYTGISDPEKAVTTHLKKYRIFFTCVDIASQLLTRHSPLAPLVQVDEWTAKPSRFSIQGSLSELSRIVALKHWKIRIADRQSGSNFSRRGKTNIQKEKRKVTYSVTLMLAFLAPENENRQLEDLPLADFALYPKDLSVRTNSINDNFIIWKLPPLLFL